MMCVIRIKDASPHITGYIRRFMVEADSGLFVGDLSRRVIDKLWSRLVSQEDDECRAVLIFADNSEVGFNIEELRSNRSVINNYGENLVSLDAPV
jgi:CRISPR-associated protein Cas2